MFGVITRRNLIKTAAGIAMTHLTGCTQNICQRITPSKRPNILLIMTDQQCADAMSCSGNRYIRTPAIDSIAANGIRFERAYCTQPLCVPSRVSLVTGKMPHETNVTYNTDEYGYNGNLIGRILADAGYDCGYVGKWHITVSPENVRQHGFASCHITNPAKQRFCRGFEQSTAKSFFSDEYIPLSCANFIKRDRTSPFFLVASFVNPHDICEWARGDQLKNGSIPQPPVVAMCPPLPDNFEIPQFEPELIRVQQAKSPRVYSTIGWPEDKWRQYRWSYNRLTELVDSYIGKILEVLRKSGLEENTLIVFTSDHGDGNAAHRWNQKMVLYDEPARIPLIISHKGVTNKGLEDKEHLVSNGLDIFKTLCDYAGAHIPSGLNGLSLKPLIEEKSLLTWRDFVVCETMLQSNYGTTDNATGRMVRTKKYKYIVYAYGKNREQLFDMEKDSGEMTNLAVDLKYASVLREHRKSLADWCIKTNDKFYIK